MNIHHLELFYYVARHGGIMSAVRHIPYGIQQPAVSGQVAQLEEHLGVTLFRRRPFALTPAGERLFNFIQPFFSRLETIESDLQGGRVRQVRIGASTLILREHLPKLFQGVRKKFPGLKITLREGSPVQLEHLLQEGQVDLIVTLIERKAPPGVHSLSLLELPLVLLVEKSSRYTSAEQLWQRDKIEEPLICLPQGGPLCQNFLARLNELGVEWFPSMEVTSVDLVETYVANGLGIGVSVPVPQKAPPANIRVIPLPDFPPVIVGAHWRGRTTPVVQVFLEELQSLAKRLTEPAAPATSWPRLPLGNSGRRASRMTPGMPP
jgi:DNA-binding transcriptional LysR family regulator